MVGRREWSDHAASSRRCGLGLAGLDDEVQQALVSANSNHVSRRYVSEHGIGNLKPEADFLGVASKEFTNEICYVRDLAQSLCNGFRNMRIEAHGGFRHLREFS